MKKTLILGVLLGSFLTGCVVTPQYNYIPQTTNISKPQIGVEVNADVGDELLMQGTSIKQDAIFVKTQIGIGMGGYVITSGYYAKAGDDDKNSYFSIGGVKDAGHVERSTPIIDAAKSIMLSKDGSRICVVNSLNTPNCANVNNSVEELQIDVLSKNSFQQSLFYKGKAGNKINISYREFSGGSARPEFNNDVEYDLSESKTIKYKGAVIEIIEATNQGITYKVIKNFNKE